MKNAFPGRLKKLRTDKEWSQAKLAQFLNISQQAYAKWELGKSQPDIETIVQLAYFFDVSIDYLLGKCNKITGI